jgi:hypothetical protein
VKYTTVMNCADQDCFTKMLVVQILHSAPELYLKKHLKNIKHEDLSDVYTQESNKVIVLLLVKFVCEYCYSLNQIAIRALP